MLPLYIGPMANDTPKTVVEMDLKRLEHWLDDLIQTCDRLNEENRQLRAQKDELLHEREALLQKSDQARSRVETIISRLRAMENSV